MNSGGIMRLRVVGFLSFAFLFGSTVQAETFFIKNNKGLISQVEISFKVNAADAVEFTDSRALTPYTSDKAGIKKGLLTRRDPTTAEKLADGAVMFLTTLLVTAIHDTYDLSDDLRMSRMSGIVLLIFPIESEDIYRKCNGNEYLVAVTEEPKDETLKQLKSLDEIRKLCAGASSSKNSS
jgi:hypothetical protein